MITVTNIERWARYIVRDDSADAAKIDVLNGLDCTLAPTTCAIRSALHL